MLWLILCLSAAIIWGFTSFIDNYLTDVIFRSKTPQAMKVINGPFYIAIAVIVGLVLKIAIPEFWQIGLLLLSGAVNSIASIPYYLALKNEEATGATIFYQLQPVLFLTVDYFIFGEQISPRQIIGFIIIMLAPVIVILARKRASARRMEMRAATLLILFVVLSTISSEIAVHSSYSIPFTTVFVFYILGRGIMDCLIGLTPRLRKRHRYVMRNSGAKYLLPTFANQLLCCVADFAYRYGMVIGVAAIASALTNSAELVLTFVNGIVLSIIWPKFGREKLQRRIVAGHVIAVVLCVIGIIIIQ